MKYEIGARIRKYREMSGFSQKELAQKIGVSNSRVSNWEQGINRPDADILADICKALNVSPSELLDVRLSPEDLSEQERKVIMAYRTETRPQESCKIFFWVLNNCFFSKEKSFLHEKTIQLSAVING